MRVYNRISISAGPGPDSFDHYLPPHERVIREDRAAREGFGNSQMDKIIYESFLFTHPLVQ